MDVEELMKFMINLFNNTSDDLHNYQYRTDILDKLEGMNNDN